jgi:hypothetical protein
MIRPPPPISLPASSERRPFGRSGPGEFRQGLSGYRGRVSPTETRPEPIAPITARKTWRTVEPLHGMIYFTPESGHSYRRLGLDATAGYFASRSAAMGPVGPAVVAATFYNFSPGLIRTSIPAAWETASPERVLVAREEAAGAALSRMLGRSVASPEMERCAELARAAAERAAERCAGRPLFAAHAGLAWPDPPHLVLWHAQTLLREFRGDGHVGLLVLHELDPVEALVMHLASGEAAGSLLRDTRGWSDGAWREASLRLEGRGLLAPPTKAEGRPTLTTEGIALRQRIEDETDRLAVHPYEALGEEGSAELRALARPFSRAVVEAGGLPG